MNDIARKPHIDCGAVCKRHPSRRTRRTPPPSCLSGILAIAALLLTATAARSTTLLAIGSDPNTFVPDQLVLADVAAQTVNTLATLGDGSLGFNGGLTFGPGGLLYAIANDSSGAGSLYSLHPDGSQLTLLGSAGGLGSGFFGGLAFDSQNGLFYAAADDNSGNASLFSITGDGVATALGQSIGTGFSGLAYDPANGLLYGIGNDNNGASTLYDFAPGGPVQAVASPGTGFGGLTWDAAGNYFDAISPVSNIAGQVFGISPAGTETGPYLTLGDGFFELAAPPASAPEPATWLVGVGLLLAKTIHGFRRQS